MTNNDHIKRSDALDAIAKWECERKSESDLIMAIATIMECMVNEIPAADVEPKRKTGHWIDVYVTNPARTRTMCSECGLFSGIGGIPSNRYKPYCPNCGSPMLPEPPKGKENVNKYVEEVINENAD